MVRLKLEVRRGPAWGRDLFYRGIFGRGAVCSATIKGAHSFQHKFRNCHWLGLGPKAAKLGVRLRDTGS